MRRREFIRLLATVPALWPLDLHAGQSEALRHVGVLMGSNESDPQMQARIAAFGETLKKLGWSDGINIQIKVLWDSGSLERATQNAKAFSDMSVDVVVANGTIGIEAASKVIRRLPIVFAMVGDPVGGGFAQSLAHPGGNVTGFSAFAPEITGKWMELLKEIAPEIKRVVVLSYPGYEFFWHGAEAAAPKLSIQVSEAKCRDESEIERSISAISDTPGAGLMVLPVPFFASKRQLIVELSATHRIPAVYPFRYFVKAGGLISYGIDTVDIYRRAAGYVDRILKGAKPAEMPVQAPTKYELVINRKAANAIGLAIPPLLLAQANEIVE